MELALFDLDNTLLAGDSDVEWPRFLINRGVLDAATYAEANDRFYEQYKNGTLDIYEFLAFQLAPLARYPRAQLDSWHTDYMREHIVPRIPQKSRDLVKKHQDRGALTVIITATNRFITGPIARELGIEHLIATDIEEVGGEFTGQPRGTPCFREGKITNLDAWLSARGQRWEDFSDTWFYSDSMNDLPLLSRAKHPVAVDPDDTLRLHAQQAGWPVMTLRD